jgi:hypothetical protein
MSSNYRGVRGARQLALGVFMIAGAGVAMSVSAPVRADSFAQRCAASGVIRCVAFDSAAELAGEYGDNTGVVPGQLAPTIDTSTKASGTGSLAFLIPSNSGSSASGSYFANFSNDLSVQFGENQQFYIQWRQRFSPEFLSTKYTNSGGFKQAIIGTGDQPGRLFASCTSLETVTQNTSQRGFAQMYNSCSGSTSHGPYQGFEEKFGDYDFKLQNGRPSPYCLYSQGQSNSYFPPAGNCFGYFPNEWMTFQVSIKTGPRVNDEFTNSFVTLWIGRENQPSQLAIQWGPYNLSAGSPADNQRFGKVWLLPYQTGKDASQTHPVGHVWYDELIISRSKIAEPSGTAPTVQPNPPTNVTAQ